MGTRILTISLVLFSSIAVAQQPKLGDIPDGNRASPVHRIPLYDETGSIILPDDQPAMPFSTKETCRPCHNYETIATGLHFNYATNSVAAGRVGEPHILTDPLTATQLPLSYRPWPGVWHPDQIGLSNWDFIRHFGRHLPGGSVGEADTLDPPEMAFRRLVSGKLEINCFACHNREAGQDQAEYAANVTRENFRWAATAASGLARVYGSAREMPDNYDIYAGVYPDDPRKPAPAVEYNPLRFDRQNKVTLDLTRRIPDERCYFCHSTHVVQEAVTPSGRNEDVHLQAGLHCVDCHRNGLDHHMTRGYEGEPGNQALTCKGCHLESGIGGAPVPQHKGIPLLHFEKLTCTACHSGPWPQQQARVVKTSRANALGTHSVSRHPESLPLLAAPVFVRNEQGKIEPRKLLWPSFWALLDSAGVQPLPPPAVAGVLQELISADTLNDSTQFTRVADKQWPVYSDSLVLQVLTALAKQNPGEQVPVFIAGGRLYRMGADSTLLREKHPAAAAVTWPLAHDVRPASQSLGVNGCGDCHRWNSPFYFGDVPVFTPVTSNSGTVVSMTEFHDAGRYFPRALAISFFFRPWFKFMLLAASVILGGILFLYFLRGLEAVIHRLSETKEAEQNKGETL